MASPVSAPVSQIGVQSRRAPRSTGSGRRRSSLLFLAPVLLFYFAFLLLPYLILLRMSLNRFSPTRMFVEALTLRNYVDVLSDPFFLGLLLRTFNLGLLVTVFSLLLGYPLALKIVRASPRAKTFFLAIALSPLLINLVVKTYAWLVLLGDHGVINQWLMRMHWIASPLPLNGNFFSVVVGLTHMTLPLMVLSLVGVLDGIEGSLIEAAESLGASSGRIFRRVVLPLSVPGIGAGSMLVFCFAISAFVTPALLGGNRVSTVSTVIYDKFTSSLNWPVGATMVFVLLAFNFAIIVLHARLFREH